ncbi:MAG: hypothetical protein H0V92_07235 [Pseudonocardiales bacterium]|nr:hypothetical protein [Pseudonocardiales bacterium]
MTKRPPTTASAGWPVMERAIVASVLGLPGYAAIGIALGFTGLGVFIDLERINGLGTIFKGCYFTGCLLSVCWVKRRALFGPMVQPPLLLAIAVPSVVLAAGGLGTNGGTASRLLAIGTPLLNGFPTMAVTTAFVLVIGIGRYRVQRPEAEPERTRGGVAARPVERERPTDRKQPERRDREQPPERERDRPADRDREPAADRRPARPDPTEDEPTSILPVSIVGPVASEPVQRPPRKSDLHRAQKRPT